MAKYANSAKIASVLEEKVHYTVDEKSQAVVLTERGFADVERILSVRSTRQGLALTCLDDAVSAMLRRLVFTISRSWRR